MDGRVARVFHVDGVVGQRGEVLGVGLFAGRGQAFEGAEDVLAGVLDNPVSK